MLLYSQVLFLLRVLIKSLILVLAIITDNILAVKCRILQMAWLFIRILLTGLIPKMSIGFI
ncbi:hypothetical protein C1459_33635 [Klebsiella pneumoniae]|nr:hypothetical protein DPZ09_00220 [Klebsiella pneumoniae]TAI73569.1 hypothetical protein C1459_33635 [Klebsiella pneumoniae]